ncbi:MAG: hypothetical protein J7L73_04895 [Anaerolineales bacterium]|nr:hypothetical protein [Anaerolineales bacterium]
MKIVVLSALGNAVAQQCIASLFKTTTSVDFDLFLVRERGFREQTLNFALSLVGTDEDVLFVGDDIEFTPGWHEALMDNYDRADILGMSMLYPGTTKVQDRGYDLVQIDDRVTLEAKDRGLLKDEITAFGSRGCDALCGCFMLVKKNVFNFVSEFSEEGQNRWGEFIFICCARKHGIKVAVIDHFLYHGGKSTKSNVDKALSSISYQAERGIWESIVNKYVDTEWIKFRYRSEISESLANILSEAEDILLYGAGTVSKHLLKYLDGKHVTICSGLPEEEGILFHGYSVENYRKALDKSYDLIVVTPLYIGKELYERYVAPRLQDEADIMTIAITMQIEKDRYIYDEQELI